MLLSYYHPGQFSKRWDKDGDTLTMGTVTVTGDPRFDRSDDELVLWDFGKEDAGRYTCSVSLDGRRMGTVTHTVKFAGGSNDLAFS